MTDPTETAPAWMGLRQEYLADLIEESLRTEHEFLRRSRIAPWRRKPRIPDGLFAHFADQAAWHVIGCTQPGYVERTHRPARDVTAAGDRSIAIGGSASGVISTGGQKSPKGVERPPLVTLQQQTPPPPTAPTGDSR